ncbi:methyltransferase [Dokdonia pacifica]|uniref:16S rRNA (Guanine(966)-N(2))-methyltransferase RsmD n=1 Tax=Dokdonia pacifica TaxID=1627892 RepID=A0A238YNR0_9FLAO|nr:RsmD family RNA methyltransferase [Dokdonia pacifica]GGG11234.1 methyltransferase [Dokdonia pacifica]SNR72331.1 16S rRNA (guanine(966)-N(2))-methyltransferase RsmD [Dokdonia pacifica]
MTRIISGKYKGRRIQAPKKLPVRPTTDMAKEALFNIIRSQFHISALRILDLFAGTGNISYEFASRGSQQIVAVDANYNCVKFINKTANEFGFDAIQTIKSDVFKYLERVPGNYDIIFADPPYDISIEDFEKIAVLIFENQLLDQDGTLIIEHSKHTKMDHVKNYVETRHYGGNAFSFFVWPESDEEE